jgi:hypothetical protein
MSPVAAYYIMQAKSNEDRIAAMHRHFEIDAEGPSLLERLRGLVASLRPTRSGQATAA